MAKHGKSTEDPTPPVDVTGSEPTTPNDGADIERVTAEAEEWRDQYVRTLAELKNVKRRHAEEADRIRDTATRHLVLALLPVIDDLELALTAGGDASDNPYAAGVQMVLTKLLGALKSVGVERIEALGRPFDHNLHEAIQPVPPTAEFPAGTVATELRPGYTQHGHVLRPAMVAVANE